MVLLLATVALCSPETLEAQEAGVCEPNCTEPPYDRHWFVEGGAGIAQIGCEEKSCKQMPWGVGGRVSMVYRRSARWAFEGGIDAGWVRETEVARNPFAATFGFRVFFFERRRFYFRASWGLGSIDRWVQDEWVKKVNPAIALGTGYNWPVTETFDLGPFIGISGTKEPEAEEINGGMLNIGLTVNVRVF